MGVEGADDVGIEDHVGGGDMGIVDRGEVDDGVGPRGCLDDLPEVLYLPHEVADGAAVSGTGHAVQHSHFVAAPEQFFHHRAADLSQSSGDEYLQWNLPIRLQAVVPRPSQSGNTAPCSPSRKRHF